MEYSILIQARMLAKRLPGKMLLPIFQNLSLIEWVYNRCLQVESVNNESVIVLIPESRSDDRLAELLKNKNIPFYRGNEQNVYDRFFNYCKNESNNFNYFFRVCADNPFIDPGLLDKMISMLDKDKTKYDYISYQDKTGTPSILTHYGFFGELINNDIFIKAGKQNKSKYENEHVTPIFYNSNKYNTYFLNMPEIVTRKDIRLTIDNKDDFDICHFVLQKINTAHFNYKDVILTLNNYPELYTKMLKSIHKNQKT